MIKQRKLKFRIRKCRRVKGMAVADFDAYSMLFQSFVRTADEKTQMKEQHNEQVQIENHYDLQKQMQFPKTQEQKQEQLIKRIECTANQYYNNEMPSLQKARNPEVQEQIKEVRCQQQKQIIINKAILQKNVQQAQAQIHQKVEISHLTLQKQQNNQQIPENQRQITQFSIKLKSPTISLNESSTIATQMSYYWQNNKLILSQPVSNRSKAIFKVINLKYCVGMGMAIKEIIQKHEYNYKSYENELSHGLFLVTSQGYSWSHFYKAEDDCFRPDFNKMQKNDTIEMTFIGDSVDFSYKKASFSLSIPASIRQKYTLCFCAYLHEKNDSVGLQSTELSQKDALQSIK